MPVVAMAEPPHGSLAEAIEHASTLLATDPEQAERLARQIQAMVPADPRAALIVGSARRRRGDPAAARAILEPLAKAHPRAAHTHYELGQALAALGETPGAIDALRRAVSVKRDLPDAWRALGDQLFAQGDIEGADAAFAEHARAAVRNPDLSAAATALFEGRLGEAERLLRGRLTAVPGDADAMRMLAETVARLGRFVEAEALLARCLQLEPGFDGARFDYADVLFRQQKGAQALQQIEPLLAADPGAPAYRNLAAACFGLVGDYGRSIALYEGLLADYPKQPRIWLNYGHALRTVRRSGEAADAYERCIALAPGLGDAYWSLANLKVATFSDSQTSAMRAQLQRSGLALEDRIHLHYALGKALEDRDDYAASFGHYAQGASLQRSELGYDAEEMSALVRRSMAMFTPAFFAARAGWGSASNEPIFIVGLPRSGSTLVEQILASHPAVEGAMELPDVGLAARDLAGPARPGQSLRYPDALADLDGPTLAALGQRYIETTRVHRRLGRPRFIDKMPNNFNHIGLIQLMLPKARIIDARRHPLGSCFSAFKQLFAQGQGFSYDLAELGRYYRDYVALMSHVDETLPGRVHRVIYEDLVQDSEGEIRRLLDHCGLPFDEACLRFHENDRAVRTVSSEQVRRPIFRDGLEQWRHFEPWLGPLKTALGPALESWRGVDER